MILLLNAHGMSLIIQILVEISPGTSLYNLTSLAISGDANWVLFYTYMLFLVNDLVGVFASKWFHHAEETKEIVSQNESEKVAQ